MAGTILKSLITRADTILTQLDDAQLAVMTWATALFEVSLSDEMGKVLRNDVLAILFPETSSSSAPTADGTPLICQDNTAISHYTIDWESEIDCESEVECQTNVVSEDENWELGAGY